MTKLTAKKEIKALFEENESNSGFSARDIGKIMGITRRHTRRLLSELFESGYIMLKDSSQKIGSNKCLIYVKTPDFLKNKMSGSRKKVSGYIYNTP
jgi:predicted ArsR family transcriptional regulator